MKFLLEVNIPTAVGNRNLKNGTLIKQAKAYLEEVKPEAVYFAAARGVRTMYLIVDLPSAEKLPEIAEPLWLDLEAEVRFTPIMDAKEFERAGPAIQKAVQSRT